MICIKPTSKRAAAAVLATCLLNVPGPAAWAQSAAQAPLRTVELSAGMHLIHAELAASSDQQATGMMFRTAMGANEGMLFVNPDSSVRCFWMRNTLLPLSIAFIATDGSIVNLADMAPRSEDSHCSSKPVQFALEMRQGWFDKHGIKAGMKLRGAPFEK
ncbi:MAG: DUF192 domain-containing protein [Pseudomonadota bacterium]|nr:DUF192 domain-containing protein [Pseudomonadota bacterium]